jgi:hypothetical protein
MKTSILKTYVYGDGYKYDWIHEWIRKQKPKPSLCESCQSRPPRDLANISGLYSRDLNDWEWLCRRCHMSKDHCVHGHEYTPETQIYRGKRVCKICSYLRKGAILGVDRRKILKSHCIHGHEFTLENTAYSNGKRVCKTCRKIANYVNYRIRKVEK